MVLVGGDRGELGLRENESAEVLGGGGVLPRGVDVDHVQPRLVLVHRVQNHLEVVFGTGLPWRQRSMKSSHGRCRPTGCW